MLVEKLWEELEKVIEARESEFSLPVFLYFARHFYLEEIDQRWIDHLKAMEALREGIGLRGYGQKDPKQEYKKEGFVIFGEMMGIIGRNVCEKLFHMQLRREETAATVEVPQPQRKRAPRRTIESGGGAAAQQRRQRQRRRQRPPRPRRARCAATSPRSAATIPAPAAAARNTRSATERWWLRDPPSVGARDRRSRSSAWVGSARPPARPIPSHRAATSSSRSAEPASPLTLLPTARLDRVGNGFLLLGRDGALVRWAPVDERGTVGARDQRAAAGDDDRRPLVRGRRAHDARATPCSSPTASPRAPREWSTSRSWRRRRPAATRSPPGPW